MNFETILKTALDRMPRPKYHLLKDPHQVSVRAGVVRYAQKLAKEKACETWEGGVKVSSTKWTELADNALFGMLKTLKAQGVRCPNCEGPKQPKYRNDPKGGDMKRLLACEDCDPNE